MELSEYLTFFIAEVEYAVSLDYVREVIPYDTVTRVPCMPETVRGYFCCIMLCMLIPR